MLQLLQALFLGRECSQCSLPAEAAEFSASYTLCPADGLAASATVAIRHTAPPPPVAADLLLPIELVEHIFRYLDVKSLCRASRCCRLFARARWDTVDVRLYAAKINGRVLSYILTKKPRRLIMPAAAAGLMSGGILAANVFQGLELNLRGVDLGAMGLGQLAAGSFPNLQVLNLARNSLPEAYFQALIYLLSKMPRLRELDLSENGLSYLTLHNLAKHARAQLKQGQPSHLQILRLSENPLTARGPRELAALIRYLPYLRELHIDGVELHNPGLALVAAAVAAHPRLEVLSLADNGLEADGIAPLVELLSKNTPLQCLDLQANDLGMAGAQALAMALMRNSQLRRLCLWDNRIGDQGAGAFATLLRTNKTLQELDLKFNCINAEGVGLLAEALMVNTTLKSLGLRFNSARDGGAAKLAKALEVNTTLRELSLEDNNVQDEGASCLGQALKTNTSLQKLNLRFNPIGDEGATGLARGLLANSGLKILDLTARENCQVCIGPTGAQALAAAVRNSGCLEKLHLGSNRVTDDVLPLFPTTCHVELVRPRRGYYIKRKRFFFF